MSEDFYSLLGVSQDANKKEIKQAYRRKAAETHPDVSDDPNAIEEFKHILRAKEVLIDEQKRSAYDQIGYEHSEQLIHTAKGENGQVELYDTKLIITRNGIAAQLAHWRKEPKEILISNITGIQFKEPGILINGYIQFGHSGQSLDSSMIKAVNKENTVAFRKTHRDDFTELKDWLDRLRDSNEHKATDTGPRY